MRKVCCKCRKSKPLHDFNRNRSKADGLAYECRECQRARNLGGKYQRTYYYRNLDKERERGRKRWSSAEKRRKARARVRGTIETLARVALRNAVQAGSITKPNFCERCLAMLPRKKIHGHHEDYSKPFDVKWVCAPCHAAAHREASP